MMIDHPQSPQNKAPNPQGKGLVPVLEGLMSVRPHPASIRAKSVHQVSAELFTTLFVLQSDFQFKPRVSTDYFLYFKEQRFRLSLISPAEWGHSTFGIYVGCTRMQADATWTIELAEVSELSESIVQIIHQMQSDFSRQLDAVESIDKLFPEYLQQLPYYQRLLGSAVSYSFKTSLRLAQLENSKSSYEQLPT